MTHAHEINVWVNGKARQLQTGNPFVEVLAELTDQPRFAVAINETFIPRSDYAKVQLQDGDRIELLIPMQGG